MKNDNHVWDNKHPTAQMLGRWQPWHAGHQKLFEEICECDLQYVTTSQAGTLLGSIFLKDKDIILGATYNDSKFNDFYKKGESFHYPFGELKYPLDDWWLCKTADPDLPNDTYASYNYEAMTQIEEGLMYEHSNFKNETAYHFDAKLFADWLKNKLKS